MELLIITGLSGAGKSRVAGTLEDMGYYCVDNLPITLIPAFVEHCLASPELYSKVVLVTDVRNREGFDELLKKMDAARDGDINMRILFVEASNEVILKRYKETRRRHPLDSTGGHTEAAIERERKVLGVLKDRADYIIDTSDYTLGMLKKRLFSLFSTEPEAGKISVQVMSFGYKHGIPAEADLVFDVRFLPNPYYQPDLRNKTGLDSEVQEFVINFSQTQTFVAKLKDMLEYLLPLYVEEGKYSLVIAFGCTGGHHRSVTIASIAAKEIERLGYRTELVHRDIDK